MASPEADRSIMVAAVEVEIPEQEARVVDHRLQEPVVAAARLRSIRARARGARRRRRYRLRGRKNSAAACGCRRRGDTGGRLVVVVTADAGSSAGDIAGGTGRAGKVLRSPERWVENGCRRMCPGVHVGAATAAVARGRLFAPGRGRRRARLLLPELLA